MSRVVQLLLMHHALRRLSARLVRPAMRHVNRSVLWQTQVVLTRALKKRSDFDLITSDRSECLNFVVSGFDLAVIIVVRHERFLGLRV